MSVWLPENTHLSLDVNRDGEQQRHVEAHFQQVIPVMGWIHGLRDDRKADLHTCSCARYVSSGKNAF